METRLMDSKRSEVKPSEVSWKKAGKRKIQRYEFLLELLSNILILKSSYTRYIIYFYITLAQFLSLIHSGTVSLSSLLYTTPGAPRVLPKCWWMRFPAQQVGSNHQEPRVASDWNLPPSAASLAVWLQPGLEPASPLSPSQPDTVPARQPPASCMEHAPSVEDHTKHTHIHIHTGKMLPDDPISTNTPRNTFTHQK